MFENARNFRDMHGTRTTDGEVLAAGRFYRTGSLSYLTEEEWPVLSELGIKLFCDLRSRRERTLWPVVWRGAQPTLLGLDVLPDIKASGEQVLRDIVSDPSGQRARHILTTNYALMPAEFATRFATLVEHIVEHQGVPVLIGCTAGQDRTGFVCALLLLALGVHIDDVMENYLESNRYFDEQRVRETIAGELQLASTDELSHAIIDALKVDERYLAGALSEIDRNFGGITAYLKEYGGLDEEKKQLMRKMLLD